MGVNEATRINERIKQLSASNFHGYLKVSFDGVGGIRLVEQPFGRIWTAAEAMAAGVIEPTRATIEKPQHVLDAEATLQLAEIGYETAKKFYFDCLDEQARLQRKARDSSADAELRLAEPAVHAAAAGLQQAEEALLKARVACSKVVMQFQQKLRIEEYERGVLEQRQAREEAERQKLASTKPFLKRIASSLGLSPA